jgi:hypothetical protein
MQKLKKPSEAAKSTKSQKNATNVKYNNNIRVNETVPKAVEATEASSTIVWFIQRQNTRKKAIDTFGNTIEKTNKSEICKLNINILISFTVIVLFIFFYICF